jgi:hypothetical protein
MAAGRGDVRSAGVIADRQRDCACQCGERRDVGAADQVEGLGEMSQIVCPSESSPATPMTTGR